GVLVSISSVGAGAIGVTFLILLYPELPMARVVGSDIAHAVPLTLIAGFGHLLMGSINWALLVTLLIGSLPGIVVGSSLAARLPDNAVRLTLAGTLLIVCGKMLFY
ncbi:MAG: TSUP family transporter, partial [Alphaproteobacteria bacterium]|nr:TSUP family transporter [Alphaproteobacteria bacterium]